MNSIPYDHRPPRAGSTCARYWDCGYNQSKYFAGKAGYHEWHAQWRLLSTWIEARRGTDNEIAFRSARWATTLAS